MSNHFIISPDQTDQNVPYMVIFDFTNLVKTKSATVLGPYSKFA